MDPTDSPQDAAFRAEARAFLDAHADPLPPWVVAPSAIVAEWSPEEEERKLAEARAWQRTKADNGWAGIAWPTRYGGRGGSLVQQLIFAEEEARYDVPRDALIVGLGWCGPAVMEHGTEEQRLRYLPPLLRGDEVWCQLFSEPSAGSDLAGLGTRAVRDGDVWRITGQKVWTTFAHLSDWGLLIARHDPDLPKHRGLTAFIVDMRSPGIEVRPLRQMTGAANFNEVFLDDVVVPDVQRVGEVGGGWGVVISTFMWERMGLVFGGSRLVDSLAALIAERGVADDPTVRDRFARVVVRSEELRTVGLRLLTALSRGGLPGPEGSIVKLVATRMLDESYGLAVDVMGSEGTLGPASGPWHGEWHAAFLGIPGLRIGGGTDQIQRNIIGERVLGLPSDPRPDKDVPWREIPGAGAAR